MGKIGTGKTKEYLVLVIIILGVFVGVRYLSPLLTPFLLAFGFVALLHPSLERLHKKFHMKKGLLTAAILLLICLTIGLLVWFFVVWGLKEIGNLFGMLDLFEERFGIFLKTCCDGIEKRFGMDSEGIETFILENVNIFIENFQVQIVPTLMNESVSYMKNMIGIVSFLAITIIAAVLLAKDYTSIRQKMKEREEFVGVIEVGRRIVHYAGTFIRAQLIILSIISVICAIVLTVVGIEGGFFLGVFTGLMDMLPFIGTGLILLPLTFWQIMNGAYVQALACFILYGVCALTREFLEPKLIGEKVGVYPVMILFSVYAGIKLFGISGIIKGPLALIMIYEIFRFWKEGRGKREDGGEDERKEDGEYKEEINLTDAD